MGGRGADCDKTWVWRALVFFLTLIHHPYLNFIEYLSTIQKLVKVEAFRFPSANSAPYGDWQNLSPIQGLKISVYSPQTFFNFFLIFVIIRCTFIILETIVILYYWSLSSPIKIKYRFILLYRQHLLNLLLCILRQIPYTLLNVNWIKWSHSSVNSWFSSINFICYLPPPLPPLPNDPHLIDNAN